MAWGKAKPVVSPLDDILDYDDAAIDRLLKKHKGSGFKNAKALRNFNKDARRPIDGESGLSALKAIAQDLAKSSGTGNRNHQNIPQASRQHPSITDRQRRELLKGVQQARARGDRLAEARLHADAKRRGLI